MSTIDKIDYKEFLKNKEDTKKDPKSKEKDKSKENGNNKPKLNQSKIETPARYRNQSLSKQQNSLMKNLSPTIKAKSMLARSLE